MARVAHVGYNNKQKIKTPKNIVIFVILFTSNAAVSAISATVTLDRLLDSDVRDVETGDIKLLVSSVGLSVLEEVEDVLAALSGPSTLSGFL